MKISILCGLLIIVLDISVFFTPAECFTFIPVSVSTGMAIIIALVKIKAIIVKVLLGLKAMGVDGFVWRRRRRRDAFALNMSTNLEIPTTPIPYIISTLSLSSQQEELMEAWHDLQQTVGKVIDFDLESCTNSAHIESRSNEKLDMPWDSISSDETESNQNTKASRNKEYSKWVSKILGSMIGDPLACQVLHEELTKPNSPSEKLSTIVPTRPPSLPLMQSVPESKPVPLKNISETEKNNNKSSTSKLITKLLS